MHIGLNGHYSWVARFVL